MKRERKIEGYDKWRQKETELAKSLYLQIIPSADGVKRKIEHPAERRRQPKSGEVGGSLT